MSASIRHLLCVVAFSVSCTATSPWGLAVLHSATRSGTAPAADCRKHVELKGSAFWAKELGQPELVVLETHRINLWEKPGPDRGKVTGKMRVGSHAVILEEAKDAYKVQSPLDKSVGWVSRIQTERTLYQDVTTFEPCKP